MCVSSFSHYNLSGGTIIMPYTGKKTGSSEKLSNLFSLQVVRLWDLNPGTSNLINRTLE